MANEIKISTNAKEVGEALAEELDQYGSKLAGQIFDALTILEAEILANIRSRAGLHVRSGSLLNSVPASKKVFVDAGILTGEIGPQGIPYAAIHEFGGTTKPHDIVPRNAKFLRFLSGGNEVFARIVHHPGSKIPARPYLRPALAARKDYILEHFGLFIKAAFPPKKA